MKGDSGWLDIRLKTVRENIQQVNLNAAYAHASLNRSLPSQSLTGDISGDKNAASDVAFLKSMLVSDEYMDTFWKNLNFTRSTEL